MTVMVINGGLEGNRHLFYNNDPNGQVTQLHTRVLMYLKITKQQGNDVYNAAYREKLNTLGMFGY